MPKIFETLNEMDDLAEILAKSTLHSDKLMSTKLRKWIYAIQKELIRDGKELGRDVPRGSVESGQRA